ncbi:esterase-like activity of phytase family protein [Aurantiacibacter aquimixticola]|uniref:Esterase-like activity of phytase family protein n=1 Tax=Aurantiacibacter aquimixticola TaxID=1958945 RepID=A0A419RUU8_9SPHN|nr:esterase-like activity of phytase family protein [Aurantiacibacter aquimixticola]RJY09524.1 esterase-like activity of phytase family protein [Aurantiacibacter aquimixticola]
MTAPRTRRKRLFAIALVALALSPGLFWRTPLPTEPTEAIDIGRLKPGDLSRSVGAFTREGLWQLRSEHDLFGGFSALLLEGDSLRAFSDRGAILTVNLSGNTPDPDRLDLLGDRCRFEHFPPDIESATRDPATGRYWLGFENGNTLLRYTSGGEHDGALRPRQWMRWPANAGAEAMARLADGRFIVLPEGSRTGLLHPSDPLFRRPAGTFAFSLPGDYAPTDLAVLPDGGLLVLMREAVLGVPPFTAALGIADPADAQTGSMEVQLLVDLDRLLPRENYEGLSLRQTENGQVEIWIISDDNLASFQRTLLARLVYDPTHEKARGD